MNDVLTMETNWLHARNPNDKLGAPPKHRIEDVASVEAATTLKPVLKTLLQATKYAADTSTTIWDFAIGIEDILELGATKTDLRWLVRKGFVEHAREVTEEGDDGRAFRPTGNLTFCDRTCFILTQSGVTASRIWASDPTTGHWLKSNGQDTAQPTLPEPYWDADLRRLHLDAKLVKRFKWPAMNQEAVLCAFQEENWPERIDDPLAPQPEQDPKRRLADTIKCLNRKQVNALIHFRGDGTGEGVVWERVESNGSMQGA